MQSLASLMSVKPTDIGNLDDFNESDEEEDRKSVTSTSRQLFFSSDIAQAFPFSSHSCSGSFFFFFHCCGCHSCFTHTYPSKPPRSPTSWPATLCWSFHFCFRYFHLLLSISQLFPCWRGAGMNTSSVCIFSQKLYAVFHILLILPPLSFLVMLSIPP